MQRTASVPPQGPALTTNTSDLAGIYLVVFSDISNLLNMCAAFQKRQAIQYQRKWQQIPWLKCHWNLLAMGTHNSVLFPPSLELIVISQSPVGYRCGQSHASHRLPGVIKLGLNGDRRLGGGLRHTAVAVIITAWPRWYHQRALLSSLTRILYSLKDNIITHTHTQCTDTIIWFSLPALFLLFPSKWLSPLQTISFLLNHMTYWA